MGHPGVTQGSKLIIKFVRCPMQISPIKPRRKKGGVADKDGRTADATVRRPHHHDLNHQQRTTPPPVLATAVPRPLFSETVTIDIFSCLVGGRAKPKGNKQVPRGFIRCDYFIFTHCTIFFYVI